VSAAPIPQTHEHVHGVRIGSINDRVMLTIYPAELK